jgi:ribose 5-phosphate isomerase B
MRIFLATDHAGFELKEKVKAWLKELNYDVHDEGAFELSADDDYPDYIRMVAKQISSSPNEDRGLIFGGSGQGEAMVANRYPHVRAAVYYGGQPEIVPLSREHNDANILSLGARFVSEIEAREVITRWLETKFSDEARHARRIAKIDDLVPVENEF